MSQTGINKGMKKFLDFISESASPHLHFFDVDDTLFHTTARVKVMKGKKEVASLSNSEYNTHNLPPGHHYDFSEFRDSEKFAKESKPIQRIMTKMKSLHGKGGNVMINTARADFDNRDRFLNAFRNHGVDIDNIHVHRAGNIKGPESVAEKKASIIRKQINKGTYKNVSLYDDSESNLRQFLELKKEFPHINFNAHHVKPDGKARRYRG